jgi:predicted lipoprotein with Yx(FWY)xxD motif
MARDATETAPARTRRGRTIKVVDSQFGAVVADRAGEALYLFDAEKTTRPACYGACAAAWPPVLAKGEPIAGRGLRAHLLGTTRRRDGRVQVTYRDRPLYYYVHDTPGRILCHDVFEYGGTWLVVAPDGRARS